MAFLALGTAVVWLGILGYVFTLISRTKKVEGELLRLKERLGDRNQ
ncbi:CcmD family protein [Microaerobacter geothermalis]|nr:CcmD family protein [Microaerobacter geothermalis]MCF6092549.1 CcmD family protein [Microaerobacter geothermalis]